MRPPGTCLAGREDFMEKEKRDEKEIEYSLRAGVSGRVCIFDR